ncbi:siphovirus Gp157 family protein [Lacticaseibacillus nasuensis]|uniref:siphovirus Gp157 family protein n=1 Tax=Lacticaseibacillus nasuensis TaxID=944671 RepID=UPI0022478086|nr:siphovirus Gp157 family protein [Lacticaseibacillus nasuensis]MCX2455657.1 siphovirus Gp157 family protein [Lacticaseibacillus nasuensis]
MATLYDLKGNYEKVYQLAEDGTFDPETMRDTLDSLTDAIEDKAIGYVKVTKQMDFDIASIDAEIKRLSERKASYTKNRDFLKKTLAEAMQETGNERFKTPLFTIYTIHTKSVVVPEDPKKLPPEFIKTRFAVDKAGVKKALKAGRDVPNARLVENTSLGVR